jgi:aryl-alcohol dehydrogenase-like predicted oxidoreductase
MNVTHPIADKILARLSKRQGEAVPVRDFLDLGTRAAVAQALSRLVRQEKIRRVGRGLYELPRMGKLLNKPVVQSPDELIQAWARKNGLRVIPSGAYAANLLGLTTQVPAKITYYTNGRTRSITLGPYSVKLLNRGPKTMDVKGQTAPLVFQALRHLGQKGVAPKAIRYLRSKLSKKERAELKRNLRYAAAWMKPIIEQIAREEND